MANPVAGFPDATNTGVPSGTSLTAYTGPMTITQAGTVIEGKIIDGSLRVTAPDVVIKNCVIEYSGWWGIDAEGARNITIQNCDIIGPGSSDDSNAGILGSGNFLRNDISNSENGIVLTGGASVVKGNYIHDLQDGGPDPHYDGISVQGNQNGVLIEGNTIIGRDTSDVFIKNDFGPISNVTVTNNLLLGTAGYTIYVDGRASGGPITGVSITNNYVEKGYWGYYSIDKSSPNISGNVEFLQGSVPPTTVPVPTTPDDSPTVPLPPAPTPTEPTFEKTMNGTSRSETLTGGSANEKIYGNSGNDRLYGNGGDDMLYGHSGNDTLLGGNGNDSIIGGSGYDVLTGGVGYDRFIFNSPSEMGTRSGARDRITDFEKGKDKIDFTAIDANSSVSGNQAFKFLAKEDAVFDGTKGQIAWHHVDRPGTSNDVTVIQGDINGDRIHDFEIEVQGLLIFTSDDFLF